MLKRKRPFRSYFYQVLVFTKFMNLGQQLPSPSTEQLELVDPAIVDSVEVGEHVEVQKNFIYQPVEILGFLEIMKKISFTPFLDLIPIHHKRYHIQLQTKDEP